jgi:N-dimethylarginine dimethylaminohydrolase
MGDPSHFSVLGGANPHTRNALGMRKRVNPDLARIQWHNLAQALIEHGTEVCVIEPHPSMTGLVYPANAGFLYPLDARRPSQSDGAGAKTFYLSNLLPTRSAEKDVYRPFISAMGYHTLDIGHRFEGEADFFPAGDRMIFTHGTLQRQRFVPRLGLPPWKRIYGFRSDAGVLDELQSIAPDRRIVTVELCLEAHYHGDTVLCSFGSDREFLLAYMEGLTPRSREVLRAEFGSNIIPLSAADAAIYVANSFQVDNNGKLYLFMPEGASDTLLREVRTTSVEPVLVNVSEFLAKGGGSIKCMILDLGPRTEQPAESSAVAFRTERSYQRLFAAQRQTAHPGHA